MGKTTRELIDELIGRYDIPIEEAEPELVTAFEVQDSSPGIIEPERRDVRITFKYFGQRDRHWIFRARVEVVTSTTRVYS